MDSKMQREYDRFREHSLEFFGTVGFTALLSFFASAWLPPWIGNFVRVVAIGVVTLAMAHLGPLKLRIPMRRLTAYGWFVTCFFALNWLTALAATSAMACHQWEFFIGFAIMSLAATCIAYPIWSGQTSGMSIDSAPVDRKSQ